MIDPFSSSPFHRRENEGERRSTMHYFALFFAFIALVVYGEESGGNCGPGGRCPANHHCVPNVGCVRSEETCQQPETPCVFPKVSDCQGGCTFKNCSTRKQCLKLTNPADRCERATCLNGMCVAEKLTCAGCNPATGCPTRRGTTTAGTHTQDVEEKDPKQIKKNWGDHDDDDDHDHDHHSETTWSAGVIVTVFFLIFMSLLIFGALAYLGYTASRTGY